MAQTVCPLRDQMATSGDGQGWSLVLTAAS